MDKNQKKDDVSHFHNEFLENDKVFALDKNSRNPNYDHKLKANSKNPFQFMMDGDLFEPVDCNCVDQGVPSPGNRRSKKCVCIKKRLLQKYSKDIRIIKMDSNKKGRIYTLNHYYNHNLTKRR
jgi:hypothetical protein